MSYRPRVRRVASCRGLSLSLALSLVVEPRAGRVGIAELTRYVIIYYMKFQTLAFRGCHATELPHDLDSKKICAPPDRVIYEKNHNWYKMYGSWIAT